MNCGGGSSAHEAVGASARFVGRTQSIGGIPDTRDGDLIVNRARVGHPRAKKSAQRLIILPTIAARLFDCLCFRSSNNAFI
jgi:hypothetical protein